MAKTSDVPYCIIAQVFFGAHLRTKRVPEAQIPQWARWGWKVVIKDTDLPGPIHTFRWVDLIGGTKRHLYRTDAEYYRDDDEADGSTWENA